MAFKIPKYFFEDREEKVNVGLQITLNHVEKPFCL